MALPMNNKVTKNQASAQTGAADSAPITTEPQSWTSFFLAKEWVLFSLILVLGLLLRWLLLDMRPYHHDESLHGMYGRYFYDFPNSNFYKYDPMLHGPMLYNCMRFIYAMFGDSLWAARTPVCIMGTLFMFLPFVFRSYFKRSTVLILTAAVALSPTLVYWSRFLREDYWVVSGMLFTMYGFTIAPKPLKAFFVMFGITIQWCTKENVFVSLAILVGYFIFEALFQWLVLGEKDTLAHRVGRYIAAHIWETVLGFVVCAIIYCWFYGAGFRYPEGIIKGLGGAAIDYWGAHHKMERIKGPFNFHLYVTAWYELPFFVAFLTHVALFYKRARAEIQFCALLVFAGTVLACLVTDANTIQENKLWQFFKLKDHLDIVGLSLLFFHAPFVTIQHLLRRERGLAAAGYFFTATFFSYSYLGEKVPWLSMYPLVFGLPYLALFFQDYFTKYPINYAAYPVRKALLWVGTISMILGIIFVLEQWGLKNEERFSLENRVFILFGVLLVACAMADLFDNFLGHIHLGRWLTIIAIIFSLRAAVQTNYVYAGKETEYLSQVHTTYELAETAKQIIDEATFERNAYRPKVYATGETTWPLTWYFRNIPQEYKFSIKPEEIPNFSYIYLSWKENPEAGYIPAGFYSRRINLRGWWVPDFKKVTLKKFLRYSVNHYPWSDSGFSYATFLVAKETAKFKD